MYTGLAYRLPMLLTWEERVVEDERIVFEQVRRAVDWTTRWQRPRLVLRAGKALKEGLIRYEQALTRIPLEYSFVREGEPAPEGTVFTIDTDATFEEPRLASDGGKIPDALKADMPLSLPANWAANYSWSQDRKTLLAFIRRCGDAVPQQAQELAITLRNFPETKTPYRMCDLETKKALVGGEFTGAQIIKAPANAWHLFLLVGGRQ